MAVTLTREELARAIRVGDSAEELAELDRLLVMATEMVTNHVSTAPDAIHNESVVRLIGYLYDAPTTARIGNPLRGSGAAAMLLPYRVMGVGYGEAVAAAQSAVGTPGNPVTGLAVLSGRLVVTFADGTTESLDLPAGMGGGDGVDQVARDAAAEAAAELVTHTGLPNVHHTPTAPGGDGTDQTARDAAATAAAAAAAQAQTTADANATNQTDHDANPNAHHIPTTPSGEAVVNSARLPVGTIALRLGWAQGRTHTDAIFTRAGNHPIDGAAVGTVAGLNPPVFPPALNTDPSLYLFIWIGTAQVNIADIRLSGGGGTLIGSISNGAAYTLEGVAGTVYVSNQRLSAGLSAYQISAVVGGDLIASQPWVTEQIAAIPAGGGGTITAILNGTLNSTRTQFAFPLAERQAVVAAWGTYNALIFAFTDDNGGTVDYRTSRMPIVVPLLTSGPQLVFHFDYGSHGDTVDHDVRLLVLPSTSTISVATAAGQTFQDGTTLIIYGET